MDIGPTSKGYIEDENDALLVLQATLDGRLKHIPRRPYEVERSYLIVSGSIFVFIEEISGIKRWTDGVPWSPSRISGKFLMYKELDKSVQYPPVGMNRKRTGTTSASSPTSSSLSPSPSSPKLKMTSLTPDQVGIGGVRRGFAPSSPSSGSSGSSNSSLGHTQLPAPYENISSLQHYHHHHHYHHYHHYHQRPHNDSKYTGFVKKTMSVRVQTGDMAAPETLHIVSYYDVEDVQLGKLTRPRDLPFFNGTKPSKELLLAMESTSLGSHAKSGSITVANSPSGTGANINNGDKMAFVGINSTAGSMGDPRLPQRQKLRPKLENSDTLNHQQQLSQQVLPNMQPLPGLRIPSFTSTYGNSNSDYNNGEPNGGSTQLPHPKFTRFIGNPLPNPYLNSSHQYYAPSNAEGTTTANVPPPPIPLALPTLNKVNSRFYGYPPGYVYYGASPHHNAGAFYPLPAGAPQSLPTQLPHMSPSVVTTAVPTPPTVPMATMSSPSVPQNGTSSRQTTTYRTPADAAD